MKTKYLFLIGVLTAITIAGVTNASAIKVWTAETLRYSDLNANFAHIHNTMVGGHGARLVDSDVASGASIAHSKLATPALLPRMWALVSTTCTTSPCTIAASSGPLTSITRGATGEYVVTMSTARANTTYMFQVNALVPASIIFCRPALVNSTTVFHISCFDSAFAAADSAFNVVMFDDN